MSKPRRMPGSACFLLAAGGEKHALQRFCATLIGDPCWCDRAPEWIDGRGDAALRARRLRAGARQVSGSAGVVPDDSGFRWRARSRTANSA